MPHAEKEQKSVNGQPILAVLVTEGRRSATGSPNKLWRYSNQEVDHTTDERVNTKNEPRNQENIRNKLLKVQWCAIFS